VIRLISFWFLFQVLLNVAVALYLTLYPPDEPTSLLDRLDLTINTGFNAALAIGFWRASKWAWTVTVWFLPLYWSIHLWHLIVPSEGMLLWPFLMVDAVILAYLLGPTGCNALNASLGRWKHISVLPVLMFALGFYASLAPSVGLGPALAAGLAILGVWIFRKKDSP
jgi:hypothetical protein